MQDSAAGHLRNIANRLHRNPVLTALTVISLIMGATASIAGVAAWRANSACDTQTSAAPRLVQDAGSDARPDLMMHQALQADLAMGVGEAAHSELAASRKEAACPCSASIGWHWQRI